MIWVELNPIFRVLGPPENSGLAKPADSGLARAFELNAKLEFGLSTNAKVKVDWSFVLPSCFASIHLFRHITWEFPKDVTYKFSLFGLEVLGFRVW